MATGMNAYLTTIRDKIYTNSNLCKLLYYDDENPLSQATIVDTSILYKDKLNQRLFFTPFTPEAQNIYKSTIHVILNDFELDKRSNFFKRFNIDFIITVNNSIWELDDGSTDIILRTNMIIDELIATFDAERNIGMGKNLFDSSRIFRPNEYYTGYRYCLQGFDLPCLAK